jgi:hypothetical protein
MLCECCGGEILVAPGKTSHGFARIGTDQDSRRLDEEGHGGNGPPARHPGSYKRANGITPESIVRALEMSLAPPSRCSTEFRNSL